MPTAILSVYDKTGLVDFARGLSGLGWKLLASGGTARLLRENNLPVTEVSEYTGSPEILSGRVKTLHPAVHGGILARATEADRRELLDHGWEPIDLVAVNLYPFEKTVSRPGVSLEEAVENIDIGGVTLIRAAAKNFSRVTLVCDPCDYDMVLEHIRDGSLTESIRLPLALKGFAHTAHYDRAITSYLGRISSPDKGDMLEIAAHHTQNLRYGENPHQKAALYSFEPGSGPLGGKLLQGKELSYTNILDLDGAWKAAVSFQRPAICIVKHASPCGIAVSNELAQAFRLALDSDPVSAFGGVVASNRPFDAPTVEAMGDLFVECIIAPGFTPEAREKLAKRKNCRLLEMPDTSIEPRFDLRTVNRGFLKQDIDFGDPDGIEWKVVSKRQPTEEEWTSLRFAWEACRHVKSNAIIFAKGEATVGIGGGQPNRVDCVRIAWQRAGEKSIGAVMASDAFFPFPDSVTIAAEAGITAVIHPGGSLRDAESIAVADANGLAMVITGARHFKH